ncbi:14384_t:CDS:2 [Entrophospora sp. SA101]|nr:14384_t:CDS:2 [Entrophospora sp. SA101]
MESLPPELLMEVYIYNEFPISFILINKRIYELCMSPIAKAKWVLRNFGKTHALFHAIRLGKSFIVVEIITSLLELKANFSRYFFQRLSQQTQSNIGEEYDPLYLNRIADSWFPDIPFDVYSLLFNEGRARAIVLEPGIVHMWKGIGHDICKDLNDLVIKDYGNSQLDSIDGFVN